MEVEFKSVPCPWLETCLREVRNGEETLELRLPDGMPDIKKVLASWGQPILRGKEWGQEQASISAGLMVWVLYAPEDDTAPRCLEGWIPFTMRWDLPGDIPEGKLRTRLAVRFVDARSVTARKIMVRGGLAAFLEAFVPRTAQTYEPGKNDSMIQLLSQRYPTLLKKEAGEKTFLLQEQLRLPQDAARPEKLISYCVCPGITEERITANRIVFRGKGNLHVVYMGDDGIVHSQNLPLAISQLGDLEESCADARSDTVLAVTSLEVQMDDEGVLDVKCSMTAQFLIQEQRVLEVISDAYCPGKETSLQESFLEMEMILDRCQVPLSGKQSLTGKCQQLADVQMTVDIPRLRRQDGANELVFNGNTQILYYDEKGELNASAGRWEQKRELNAEESVRQIPYAFMQEPPSALSLKDSIEVSWDWNLEVESSGQSKIPMVMGMMLGENKEISRERPSVILKRIGTEGLWSVAKSADTTIEKIRRANGLAEDPEPGRMLLIPV